MITEKTIAFLDKRAKTDLEKKAVSMIEYSLKRYKEAIEYQKKLKKEAKKPRGYESGSSHEMRHKAEYRNEEELRSLKTFLFDVQAHKSDSLIFYWVLSDPMRFMDYYHGLAQDHLYFSQDKWKQKYIKKIFGDKKYEIL
jgi:hypothetical protein